MLCTKTTTVRTFHIVMNALYISVQGVNKSEQIYSMRLVEVEFRVQILEFFSKKDS